MQAFKTIDVNKPEKIVNQENKKVNQSRQMKFNLLTSCSNVYSVPQLKLCKSLTGDGVAKSNRVSRNHKQNAPSTASNNYFT